MEIELNQENGSVGNISTLERRVDPRSPMSAGRLSASTMSMRAKAKRKRLANAQHNSNFKAGYVPVDEDVLMRSGIRGRKRYFLYCFLVFLLIIVVLNAMVTAWLIYIIGITHNGMLSIEMVDIGSRHFLRVLADANIITMSFSDQGFIAARHNKHLSFTTLESMIKFQEPSGSTLTLEEGNITLSGDDITVYSSTMDKNISITLESIMANAGNLNATNVTASEIESLQNYTGLSLESIINTVNLEAMEDVEFLADEGMRLGNKRVKLEAQNDIVLDGGKGIFVDPNLMKISILRRQDPNLETYKLCVCETGRVFRVLVTGNDTTCDVGEQLHWLCAS